MNITLFWILQTVALVGFIIGLFVIRQDFKTSLIVIGASGGCLFGKRCRIIRPHGKEAGGTGIYPRPYGNALAHWRNTGHLQV